MFAINFCYFTRWKQYFQQITHQHCFVNFDLPIMKIFLKTYIMEIDLNQVIDFFSLSKLHHFSCKEQQQDIMMYAFYLHNFRLLKARFILLLLFINYLEFLLISIYYLKICMYRKNLILDYINCQQILLKVNFDFELNKYSSMNKNSIVIYKFKRYLIHFNKTFMLKINNLNFRIFHHLIIDWIKYSCFIKRSFH